MILLSEMHIPQKAYYINGKESGVHSIPVFKYKLLVIGCVDNCDFTLQEIKRNDDDGLTEMYTHTENKTFFSHKDFFEFYSLLRKNVINYRNYSNMDNKSESEKYHNAYRESALAFCKSKLHINLKNTFYTNDVNFILNFDSIEDLLTENIFNDVSIIEFEKMVKSFFNANLMIDYTMLGARESIKTLKEYNASNETVFEYTCSNLYDVFFAVLHYYKVNGYKLKKCKLCHSLFFANNLKEEYCQNPFSYIDFENIERKYPCCATKSGARKKLWDKLQRRKNVVYDRLKKRCQEWGILENDKSTKEFLEYTSKCIAYEETIKENPCIDNFVKYEHYLYIECENIYKKYERRK